jgi:hypothetical protein
MSGSDFHSAENDKLIQRFHDVGWFFLDDAPETLILFEMPKSRAPVMQAQLEMLFGT